MWRFRKGLPIGQRAFAGCMTLIELELPKSGGNRHRGLYGCGRLSKVKFPKTMKKIGGSAFYGCRELSSLSLLRAY